MATKLSPAGVSIYHLRQVTKDKGIDGLNTLLKTFMKKHVSCTENLHEKTCIMYTLFKIGRISGNYFELKIISTVMKFKLTNYS